MAPPSATADHRGRTFEQGGQPRQNFGPPRPFEYNARDPDYGIDRRSSSSHGFRPDARCTADSSSSGRPWSDYRDRGQGRASSSQQSRRENPLPVAECAADRLARLGRPVQAPATQLIVQTPPAQMGAVTQQALDQEAQAVIASLRNTIAQQETLMADHECERRQWQHDCDVYVRHMLAVLEQQKQNMQSMLELQQKNMQTLDDQIIALQSLQRGGRPPPPQQQQHPSVGGPQGTNTHLFQSGAVKEESPARR